MSMADPPRTFLDALPDDIAPRRRGGDSPIPSTPTGTVVLAEGDLSTDFFVILSGTVEVLRGGAVINRLGEGEVFGEAGALDPGPGYAMARNATIRAATASELGRLAEDDFTRLFAGSDEFRTAVHALLSARS